jgi:hypothetical protein
LAFALDPRRKNGTVIAYWLHIYGRWGSIAINNDEVSILSVIDTHQKMQEKKKTGFPVKYIRWIKKIDECMNICSRMNGCDVNDGSSLRVCKLYNPSSYNKLNKLFQSDE